MFLKRHATDKIDENKLYHGSKEHKKSKYYNLHQLIHMKKGQLSRMVFEITLK
jgi:hypothetical protein